MKTLRLCKWCVWVAMLLMAQNLFAQQLSVKGTVLSGTDHYPVVGASVVEKGTTNGIITDMDGNFSLSVAKGAIIQISYIGFVTQEIPVKNGNKLDIILNEDVQALGDIVVTGYASQKKADLTGSVSVVKMDEIENMNTGNAMKSLQGRVPGMMVTTSGAPDGGATVRIRGIGTLGNNDPLYIIDGVPSKRSMNELASADIESIQVLKDASSASIYGSRAANGVIIITTKKGKKGETKIDVRASLTAQNYPRSLDLLNTQQLGAAQWRAIKNDGGVGDGYGIYTYKWHGDETFGYVLDEVLLPEFLDEKKTMVPADTDWVGEIGRTGFTQNYNVTISHGGEKSRSLFAVDYFDNKGTVKGSGFNRATVRMNSDYTLLNGRLTIGENFSVSKVRKQAIDGGLINQTHEIQPSIPVHTVDGVGWGGPVGGMSDRHNPMRIIADNKQNHEDYVRLFGDLNLDLEIIKNLHFRSKFGVDYTGFWKRNMQLKYVSGFMSEKVNKVNVDANYEGNWVLSNTLNYNISFGKHGIDALAGQEMLKFYRTEVSAGRDVFVSEDPDYMYLNAGESNKRNGNSATAYALLSYFGKINYNYDNRYLVSATVRYDGSSRFGINNRYGVFPAFSLGWRLSEESFFKEALPWVSDLKFRYGWGKTGNQEIGDFASAGLYEALYGTDPTWGIDSGTAYDIYGTGSGDLLSGYRRTQLMNANLRWESTMQNNIGVDFGFLNQKFTGSFDYFYKKTEDILIKPPFIATLGEGGDRWVNGASMDNKGFEFMMTYNEKIGEVNLAVTGNISRYVNKVVKLPEDVINSYPGNGNDQTILGRPLNSFFGYVADGIFQNEDEVNSHVAQTGKGVGRIRYKNVNGDDKVNDEDRTWLGVADPDFIYGLNVALSWKNFDFSMFWNGLVGSQVNNSVKRYSDFIGLSGGHNYGIRTLDAWSPQNTSSTIPALSMLDLNNENRFSTYFIENGSYLKLANIEIGYTLPKHIVEKARMSNARFYVMGQNILTLKKTWGDNSFTSVDPETPNLGYPIPFSVTFGVNVSF